MDVTRNALEILREFDIPFQVLTKGGMRASRDFDLYGPRDAFATTLTLIDSSPSQKIEPKAALPHQRIDAIFEAKERGLMTWVSLEPVIDPDDSLTLIKLTWVAVDLYKIGKLNYRQSDIDWQDFGRRAIDLCEMNGIPYYIKDDLAKDLEGVEYTNTDTRRVKRND